MFAALGLAVGLLGGPAVVTDPAALDGLFANLTTDGPGCAVSATQGGMAVFERAYGLANVEQATANTSDTVFEVGSVSKQFTAAVLVALASQGALSLDDSIRAYLPEMPEYANRITIRMLLTHVSGLRNWDDLAELAGFDRGSRVYSQDDAYAMIARQQELGFEPGSEYLYSNSNYVLAMLIAERATGQTFGALSRALVFEPAGMRHTQWRTDYTAVVPDRAEAYTPDDAGVLHLDMPFENVVGPGGLLTTVGDLQRWNAFRNEPPESAAAWIQMMQSRQTLTGGVPTNYGMGLEYSQISGHSVVSHAGSTAGYRAYLAWIPDVAVSVGVLCNAGAINTEDLGPRLVSALLPPLASPPETSAPAIASASGSSFADLAGVYRNELTRQRATVSVEPQGVRFNAGGLFIPAGTDTFKGAEGAREAIVSRSPSGAVASISLSRIGNRAVTLTPVETWTPRPDELAAFDGDYYSAEALANWTIRQEGDDLRATGPRGETFLLDPIYVDAFGARDGAWTFTFARDADGDPVSFRAFKTRTRGVSFERVGQ